MRPQFFPVHLQQSSILCRVPITDGHLNMGTWQVRRNRITAGQRVLFSNDMI